MLPTKELVDPVSGDTPIFVERYDGHEALANSAAMKLAGVNSKTADVPGGVIVRDANGNPTGVFKDAAMSLISKTIPPMSHDQRLRAARAALKHAASVGVTSVQHMNPEFAEIAAYSELAEKASSQRASTQRRWKRSGATKRKLAFVARGARVPCDSGQSKVMPTAR